MADDPTTLNELNTDVAEADTPEDNEPSYRVVGDARIPVSKHLGKLWESRIKAATAKMKPFCDAWDEALQYYNHDQLRHRVSMDDTVGSSGNTYYLKRRNSQWGETENIVYANINAMVPAVYAKNPTAEFTSHDEDDAAKKQRCADIEKVINKAASLDHAPGVSMKSKAKQAAVLALLTDLAWGEVGYVFKQESSEQAMADLQRIEKEYSSAKDVKQIRELEGQMMAIEELFDFLTPEGLTFRIYRPHDVLVDPDSVAPDYSDALWMSTKSMIPTSYLNARYGQKGEDGKVMSVYEPTHVLCGTSDGNSVDLLINNFRILTGNDATDYAKNGYNSQQEYDAAKRTCVHFIWDKVTRRVYMYHSKDMKWPIWVFPDPYNLPRFFPLRPLSFHMAPIGNLSKGEVTYYLDQQDAVNDINDEEARMRLNYKNNIMYDSGSGVTPEEVEKFLKGPNGTAVGVKMPEGKTFKDCFIEPPFKMKELPTLFDKQKKLEAIDRIAGVGEVVRGVQFKTNTTNQAIESYQATTQLRLDEKVDAIEDWIGGIYYDMAFIALQVMPQEIVLRIAGTAVAQRWDNMLAKQIEGEYEMRVVGGSSQKPTSSAKKQQALQLGQILGQFAKAAPRAVVTITLKLFQSAFPEVDITEEEWNALIAEADATVSGAMGAGPDGAAGPPGAGGVDQLAKMFDSLPPEAKQALGAATAKGVPVVQALQEIMARMQRPSMTKQ